MSIRTRLPEIKPSMMSVPDGTITAGFLLRRADGFEAFDRVGRSIGKFKTQQEAAARHSQDQRAGPMTDRALTEPIVVAEFWANRRGESIRVQLRKFEGVALVDVRKHYTGAEGKLLPTKKGLSLTLRRLPDLAAAITKALEKARALGLIREGGE
jgi:hypothetical protein